MGKLVGNVFVAGLLLVAAPPEKHYKYVCVRWAWTGDAFNRIVHCLKWEKVEI